MDLVAGESLNTVYQKIRPQKRCQNVNRLISTLNNQNNKEIYLTYEMREHKHKMKFKLITSDG